MMNRKKYNTVFDVTFSVDHDCKDPFDVSKEKLIEALEKRLKYLKENPSDAAEAFGFVDTCELWDDGTIDN